MISDSETGTHNRFPTEYETIRRMSGLGAI